MSGLGDVSADEIPDLLDDNVRCTTFERDGAEYVKKSSRVIRPGPTCP